ncbi:N-acetylglucosamine kinase-like BadF-type ATPase [Dysgonomonas hofstadii]|uniref:N-acetylglucosamine kinase-like BadF-type ATPase n=1 Tax=Dysgonomonas hofstadii TaxID=637886 RepID=A0A840CU96_9BACT|nr:BadF/BadG/BcrA/BcrD ATPase family protein [Dysgonomonas hofstadii]MBB4035273.1 N-acetylglucosamine kinase-like BadF-type ATPase [Dysgonomonas hofstadii]
MIILADGGSTKVDWRFVDGDKEIKQASTKGANPFFRTREDISEEIRTTIKPMLNGHRVDSVHFFGAGCASPEKNQIIIDAITDNIKASQIEVDSDLLAAAKGLCGSNKGIACILGTGSNSCYYDGEKIADNVSPLGYILGDEGSGAVIGRLFLGACLKNQLTKGLKEKFLQEFDLTPALILDKVYKQPMANRFLASLSPFLINNIEDKTIQNLIYGAFKDFFMKNVMQYDYMNNEVHFTGSVAYHYRDILRKAGEELNIKVGNIVQSPMEGLIKYYGTLLAVTKDL